MSHIFLNQNESEKVMREKCKGCKQSFNSDELNSVPSDDHNANCEDCESEINSNNNDYWGS